MASIEERRKAALERAKQLDGANLDGTETTIAARRAQALAAARQRDTEKKVAAQPPSQPSAQVSVPAVGADLAKGTMQMGMGELLSHRQALTAANKEMSAYNQRQQELAGLEEKYADDSDFMKGVKSIGATAAATVPMAKDTVVGAVKDLAHDKENTAIRGTEEYQALAQEYRRLQGLKRTLNPKAANYKARVAEIEKQMAENESTRAAMMKRTAIDPNSTGMQKMREANWLRQEATEDLSGAGLFAANTALSIGQNLAVLPTAAINPAIPLVAMGTMAGAQKAYEVTEAGGYAGDALARGIISGGIEAATEKMGVDHLLDLIKTGGKTAVANMLKQAGAEATEEAVSYVVNFAADKAANDPNATWSWAELAESAAAGGVSGLFFGGAGTAANQTIRTVKQYAADNLTGEALVQANRNLDLLESAEGYKEGSETRKLADAIMQDMEHSENALTAISNAQWGKLYRTMQKELDTAGPEDPQAREDTVQTMHPDEKVMSPTAQAFIDAGDDAATADAKSVIMDRILAGDTSLTDTELRKLDLRAPSTKAAFTALTGMDVPQTTDTKTLLKTYRAAAEEAAKVLEGQAALEKAEAAMLEGMKQRAAAMAEQAEAAKSDTPAPEVAAQEPQVVSEYADTVVVEGGQNLTEEQFISAYLADNPDAERSAAEAQYREAVRMNGFGMEYPAFQAQVQKSSVGAAARPSVEVGQENSDRMGVDTTQAEGAVESPAEAKTETVKKEPSRMQKLVAKAATDALKGSGVTGVDVAFDGFGEDENAFHDKTTGRIVLNGNRLTNARAMMAILGHELTHPSADVDSKVVQQILDFGEKSPEFVQRWLGAENIDTALDEMRERYIRFYVEQKGMNPDDAAAMVDLSFAQEEVAGDLMMGVFADTDAMQQLARHNATLLQRARDTAARLVTRLAAGKSSGARAMRTEGEWLVNRMDRALRGTESRGTMNKNEEVRHSVETTQRDDGRRTESSNDFVDRVTKAGGRVGEVGEIRYGYTPVDALRISHQSGDVQRELNALGVECFVHEGLEVNSRGLTVKADETATTIGRKIVGVSNDIDISAKNVAGHEAFHVWGRSAERVRFVEALNDNLDFGASEFRELLNFIEDKYFGQNVELQDDQSMDMLMEEVCAYICGDLHAGTAEANLRGMLRDYKAVKGAWGRLISEMNTAKEGTPSATGEDAFSVRRSLGALPDFQGGITERKLRQIAQSPEFQAWFHDGNGELVNPKTGLPYVFYHGTGQAGYTRFEAQQYGEPGFWFAKHAETSDSEGYTGREPGDPATREFRPQAPKSWKKMVEYIESEYPHLTIELDDYTGMYVVSNAETWENLGAYKPTKASLAKLDRDLQELSRTGEPGLRDMPNPGIYQVFLSMKNPLVVECGGVSWSEIDVRALDGTDLRGKVGTKGNGKTTTNMVVSAAQKAGYDGVIFKNVLDGRMGNGQDVAATELPAEVQAILDAHNNFGAPNADAALDTFADLGFLPGLSGDEEAILSDYVSEKLEVGEMDRAGLPVPDDDFVVFDSAQIKSVHNTGTFDAGNPDIRYSVSKSQPFSEQVHRALTEGLEENRYNALYIRETPQALAQVGLGDLPMCMTAAHVKDINSPEGHDIPEGLIMRLPVLLSTPAAVLDSRTRKGTIIIVTQARDRQGRPVVVSVKPDGRAVVDGEFGPANFITSMYGRNDFERYIETSMEHNNFLAWNQERMNHIYRGLGKNNGAPQWTMPERQSSGLSTDDSNEAGQAVNGGKQYPVIMTDGSTEIIRNYQGYVKDKTPERRFSVSKKGDAKTGGNTGNINPETGYESGSVADSFMRILNTGDRKGALDMLERAAQQLAQAEAERAEQRKQQLVQTVLRPKLSEDAITRNKRIVDELIAKYGEMEQTSAAQREVHIPKQIDPETKVRGFMQTAMAAQATTEDVSDALTQDILSGTAGTTYTPVTDNAALREVQEAVKDKREFAKARAAWSSLVDSGQMPTKQDIAKAEALYVQACAEGQVFEAQKLAAEIAVMGTQAGQVVQAMTLVKRMTPAGQLYYIQKTVDRLNADKAQKDRNVTLKIDPKLAKQLLEAKNKAERDAALDAITQSLADQMPVTIYDKWNTWRYLAMLGNPRTHIRNLLGNAVFTPARLIKDTAAMGLEHMVIKDQNQRTKGFADKALRDFARQDAELMEDELRGGGKYDPKDLIRDKRRIFKTGVLNWAEKFNSSMLEKEDWWFLRGAYTKALSGFLAARGFTAEQVSGPNSTKEGRAALDQGRIYAIQEAQKATYRDASKVAQWINHTARNSGPIGSILWGGLMPFTKTPVNIVKRGLEYSPVGLLKSIVDAKTKLKSGEMTAAQVVDELAAGLTGTSIMVLGYFLARAGLLVGGLGDDDEDKFQELQGMQEYSLNVGGESFTIDWAAPTVLPLFVGEALHRLEQESADGDLDGWDWLEASMGLLDPVMSLSMLDGLNNTLSAVKYDTGEPIPAILQTIFGSYVSQIVPTVLGAVARTMDESRRTSFTPKGQTSVQRWLSRLWQTSFVGKTPIASEGRMAYVDEWGRVDTENSVLVRAIENFVSPGYINPLKESPLEGELSRLAEATGDNGVYPNKAQKYFSADKKEYVMTQDEYQEHLIYRGQKSYKLAGDITTSRTYAGLDDKTRAKAVELAYDYAAAMAKVNTTDTYAPDKWMVKLAELERNGGDAAEYLMLRAQSKVNGLSLTEQVLQTDTMTAVDAAEILVMERTMPGSFTDPYIKGYEYQMDDAQQARYARAYREKFIEAYLELSADEDFQKASLAERKEMVSDLGTEVNSEVKYDMADWMDEHGFESVEKE